MCATRTVWLLGELARLAHRARAANVSGDEVRQEKALHELGLLQAEFDRVGFERAWEQGFAALHEKGATPVRGIGDLRRAA